LFQDISIDELLPLINNKQIVAIDVRSPSEFADSTIPGSLNIPLFNDEERAEVGTIYKQVSENAAKERGLELFSAKLPAFIKMFEQIEGPKVVFCWRGGMRSKTTATVLSLMGIRVSRLTGGIRTYRKRVIQTLEQFELKPEPIVLQGNTGTGKTAIIRQLQQEGYPAIDLEGMAKHRGSIFGHVGLRANNQKTFDSFLVTDLLKLQESPYILFEGESQRIGKVLVPQFLMSKKETTTQIVIQLPIEERVRHIIEDYRPSEHKLELISGFNYIKDRIHTPVAKEIMTYLETDQFDHAVRLLLEHYYDPRYEHSMQINVQEKVIIEANTIEEALQRVKDFLAKKSYV